MNRSLTDKGPATTIGDSPIDPGRAFPIAAGSLSIDGGTPIMAKADPTDTAVELHIEIEAGRHTLQGWFHDNTGKKLAGAFYGRVEKL